MVETLCSCIFDWKMVNRSNHLEIGHQMKMVEVVLQSKKYVVISIEIIGRLFKHYGGWNNLFHTFIFVTCNCKYRLVYVLWWILFCILNIWFLQWFRKHFLSLKGNVTPKKSQIANIHCLPWCFHLHLLFLSDTDIVCHFVRTRSCDWNYFWHRLMACFACAFELYIGGSSSAASMIQ